MQKFASNTKIYTGRGSLSVLKTLVKGKLLVVTDPYFMKNGTAQRIAGLSGAAQVQYFDQVQPDPEVTLAAKGASAVQAFGPDTVLALGGGSAMDCAKAMTYFSGSAATLIAVPTTSGSGSEVTDFSILTHDGIKHPLVDEKLVPQAAILDGELLDSLPGSLIADTGFDALSHALEACAATGASAITDSLAQGAFCTVMDCLEASYRGDKTVRQSIHEASCMAGMAFSQAGLGLCHALAHSLGGLYHLPHGRLNAILLPAVVDFNASAAGHKYAHMARLAGIGGASDAMAVRSLKAALVRLRRLLALPGSLQEAGVEPARLVGDMELICKAALEDGCVGTNPVPVTKQDICHILHRVKSRG